jgi:hypothetical protein
MTDVTRCPEPDTLLVLLYDDEGTPEERAVLQDHVDRCLDCADVLTSLDTARGALGAWHAPRLPLGFALVRPGRSPVRTALWRGGLAAAAVLVLAAAASLAQFDISYDAQGLRIRTGVSRSSVSAIADGRGTAAAPALATARPAATPATEGAWVGKAAAGEPPWRADLDLLATQIRGDVARLVHESRQVPAATAVRAAIPAAPAVPGRGMTDAELLKRVQDLLDQSEIRQQSNLALRVTELGRQFELARQSDIVQVEQTLQRIEQQRGELLRRVSSTQPRP